MKRTEIDAMHAGYAEYRKPLLQGGVEVFEFKPAADREQKGKFDK